MQAVYDYLKRHGTSRCSDIAKSIGKHQGATLNALRELNSAKLVVHNTNKTWSLTIPYCPEYALVVGDKDNSAQVHKLLQSLAVLINDHTPYNAYVDDKYTDSID